MAFLPSPSKGSNRDPVRKRTIERAKEGFGVRSGLNLP